MRSRAGARAQPVVPLLSYDAVVAQLIAEHSEVGELLGASRKDAGHHFSAFEVLDAVDWMAFNGRWAASAHLFRLLGGDTDGLGARMAENYGIHGDALHIVSVECFPDPTEAAEIAADRVLRIFFNGGYAKSRFVDADLYPQMLKPGALASVGYPAAVADRVCADAKCKEPQVPVGDDGGVCTFSKCTNRMCHPGCDAGEGRRCRVHVQVLLELMKAPGAGSIDITQPHRVLLAARLSRTDAPHGELGKCFNEPLWNGACAFAQKGLRLVTDKGKTNFFSQASKIVGIAGKLCGPVATGAVGSLCGAAVFPDRPHRSGMAVRIKADLTRVANGERLAGTRAMNEDARMCVCVCVCVVPGCARRSHASGTQGRGSSLPGTARPAPSGRCPGTARGAQAWVPRRSGCVETGHENGGCGAQIAGRQGTCE